MNKDFILNTKLTENQIALFYLGQEGYLLKYKDTHILIDPYLSDYVDKNCCRDGVEWIRKYPAPIEAETLDFIDYVLCTHSHYDHMDPDTLGKLAKVNPAAFFIAPAPVAQELVSYGIRENQILKADVGTPLDLKDMKAEPIPSAHEELHQDENGDYYELGYILTLGEIRLYHGGDCCIYEGLSSPLENIDILMVPVNGRSYYKLKDDIIGNMTAEEAVLLAKECKADMMIPMHYDLYDINCIRPAHFVDWVMTINPLQKFHLFVPGERFIYER